LRIEVRPTALGVGERVRGYGLVKRSWGRGVIGMGLLRVVYRDERGLNNKVRRWGMEMGLLGWSG